MAVKKLTGHRVAILAMDGFEQRELFEPLEALREAGADVHIVSPKSGVLKGWHRNDWGQTIEATKVISEVQPADYDALMIPGGVMSPDKLRTDLLVLDFVHDMVKGGKPVAAICHAPWILIDAGVVRGRTLTSWPSLKTDLTNAGAHWINQEVVNDHGLITSRMPEDLPAFNKKMVEEFAEGKLEPVRRSRIETRVPPNLQ